TDIGKRGCEVVASFANGRRRQRRQAVTRVLRMKAILRLGLCSDFVHSSPPPPIHGARRAELWLPATSAHGRSTLARHPHGGSRCCARIAGSGATRSVVHFRLPRYATRCRQARLPRKRMPSTRRASPSPHVGPGASAGVSATGSICHRHSSLPVVGTENHRHTSTYRPARRGVTARGRARRGGLECADASAAL